MYDDKAADVYPIPRLGLFPCPKCLSPDHGQEQCFVITYLLSVALQTREDVPKRSEKRESATERDREKASPLPQTSESTFDTFFLVTRGLDPHSKCGVPFNP